MSAPISPATRFYRAARAYATSQITDTYDEALEDEYEAARRAMLRVHSIERVDAVEDLAYRVALREARS